MKSQFLSFASHQIKAPLAAIKWQAQLFADGTLGKLPAAAIKTARDIELSADQLVRLVENFLDLRRLEEGKVKYEFKRTNLAGLTQDVVRDLTPSAQQKQLRLDLVVDAARPWARVDPMKFRQVIQNLVDNACKYTDRGTITVRVSNEGANILISVADTGRGIPAGTLSRIFMQYVRDPSTEHAYEGSGLGLYIAKQIVQAHHGDIWATSPGTNRGSTFFVRISSVR
jgi:two-component system sensor histidine kinase VicK